MAEPLASINESLIVQNGELDDLYFVRRILRVTAPFLTLLIAGMCVIAARYHGEARGWPIFVAVLGLIGFLVASAFLLKFSFEERAIKQKILILQEARRGLVSRESRAAPLVRYRESVPDFVTEYRASANHYRRVHNIFQAVVIIGSIAASTVSSAGTSIPSLRWVGVGLTMSVGISAGFTGYFKFKERSLYLQQTSDAIEHEYQASELSLRHYRGKSERENLIALAEEVERLRQEQRQREQQLDQPAESQRPSGAGNS